MSITSMMLRRLQSGLEVTKGAEVNATQVLVVDSFAFDDAPTVYLPKQNIGLLADRHPGVVTGQHITFNVGGDVTFEQLPYWLNTTLKKVTAGAGAGADKTWTFAPSPTGADDFQTFTFETRETDGTNNIDHTYVYGLGSELTISGDLDAPTKFDLRGFAKQDTTNTITAALSIPTNFTLVPAQTFTIYRDSAWANLGNVQVTGQMYQFSWKLTTGLTPAFYEDGSLYMTRHRRVRRAVELTLTLDNEASSGLGETFRAAIKTRALQYIRLTASGSNIGNTSNAYQINIDGAYTVDKVTPPSDHDGEGMVTATLTSKYDSTAAQDIRCVVRNADSALT